ncbi:MAG: valine--tRNA ligase [Bacteroidales bacterium]|nr:valine--tRNA ligase [Bacteroidales bacterium]
MEIAKKFDPALFEDKWYKHWMEKGFFTSVPDEREPYTIVIPPPNVTGVLHMGHILNNTIQDILIRKARMQGKNACWLPGTDHASIATEARVVAKLKSEGIEKSKLSREEFLKHAWEWTHKHGGIILEQLKKLGASCDWNRTKFTMDDDMSESVIDVFIDLYKKGFIYRDVRMVNWDPKALTAISDEEVIFKEVKSKLYYVRYKIEGTSDEWISIATTRPETILGDTAVCVHPDDERYKNLKGKNVIVPLVNRKVPVISDEYVTREFGTGALKVTPAHDINDYNLGIKHKLKSIDIFNDNGTLNEKAEIFIGEDRFTAREKVVEELKQKGHLVKVEEIINNIGFSERTDEIIEPKLSMQWFCDMTKFVKPALDAIINDTIKVYPSKFKNTYRHWMENIHNWCISRQLWWGHRIPVYYMPDGEIIVAKTKEDALKIAKKKNADIKIENLKQDEDVLDTWFSSWLWPVSVFDGIRNPENKDIKYYYPTDDLITAPEILFFWVARMIMAGYEYQKNIPFKNVYLTGTVRDKQGRKMSKSLGNSPEPIELIKKYGADGVRVGMMLCSPAGGDLLFDESLMEQGRNFSNKIWNAFRLIKGWEIDENIKQPGYSKVAIEWFDAKFNESIETVNSHFEKYRISEALMAMYKLIWDDFCSWYLEMIKPAYQQPIDKKTSTSTIEIFEKLLKFLHPFMPFITEEIWHLIKERKDKDCIIISQLPDVEKYKKETIDNFEYVKEIIVSVRTIRQSNNIPLKEKIELKIKKTSSAFNLKYFEELIIKLLNLDKINYVEEKPQGALSFLVKSDEFYVPLNIAGNVESEVKKLKEEINYLEGFLNSVNKKLSNEKFVKNAKAEIIETEQRKKADAEAKISVIKEKLNILEKSKK